MTKDAVIDLLNKKELIDEILRDKYDINDFTVIRQFSESGTRVEKDIVGRWLFLSNRLSAFKTIEEVRVDIRYKDDGNLEKITIDRYRTKLLVQRF